MQLHAVKSVWYSAMRECSGSDGNHRRNHFSTSFSFPLLLSPLFYTSWSHSGPPFILLDSHCHVFYDWMWRPPLAGFSALAILWQCFNTSAFHVSASTTMEMQNCIFTISLAVGSSAKHFYYYGPRVRALLWLRWRLYTERFDIPFCTVTFKMVEQMDLTLAIFTSWTLYSYFAYGTWPTFTFDDSLNGLQLVLC